MCGIAGIFDYGNGRVDRDQLLQIREQMVSRGPDADGIWLNTEQTIGLAHRRLSIIDLSANATQPMATVDQRFVIVFNGEIYNYQALRQELLQHGVKFASESDTEVLLHLYHLHGADMLSRLRGMFAFAIWDNKTSTLFLARDPFGIKPLYYAHDSGVWLFASQVKALIAGAGLAKTRDPAGLSGYFLFGSIPEPYTLFRDVRALPAGSYMLIDKHGQARSQQYFSLAEIWPSHNDNVQEQSEAKRAFFAEAMLDSVKHHLVADVPVGAFLSAGIDSSALVALMRDAGQSRIQTLTLAFDEFSGQSRNEAPLAEYLADYYATEHVSRVVTATEFGNDLENIVAAMDQPSIDGVNTWFVSKATHELGLKVALSGLGADELLGGYPSFARIPGWVQKLRLLSKIPGVALLLRFVYQGMRTAGLKINPKVAGLLSYGGSYPGAYFLSRGLFMPWELADLGDEQFFREGLQRLLPLDYLRNLIEPQPASAYAKVATLEAGCYMRNQLLRDTDWASMAHSLEVRVPYVDHVLWQQLAGFLTRQRQSHLVAKHWLADSPSKPLPDKVKLRTKTGFETPVQFWLEQHEAIQQWRSVPSLQAADCHWSRRWAYSVLLLYEATIG